MQRSISDADEFQCERSDKRTRPGRRGSGGSRRRKSEPQSPRQCAENPRLARTVGRIGEYVAGYAAAGWVSRSKGQSVINEVVCPRSGCKKMKFPSRKHRGRFVSSDASFIPGKLPGPGARAEADRLPPPARRGLIYPASLNPMPAPATRRN